MKKLKSAFYLFAAALMTFSACSDDEDPVPDNGNDNNGQVEASSYHLISL